jgi:phosphoribosylglycinamide formyltransferase 1
MKKFKIAVLASTKGTDLQAIIDRIKDGTVDYELAVVISNKKNAYALERAKSQGFKALFVDTKNKTREQFDEEVKNLLVKENVDLIVLVGYMRIFSVPFVRFFKGKIINIHPALIPKYSGPSFFGSNVHEAVLKNNEKESGMTIHFVTEEVDKGPIILQKKCRVDENETPETLKEKVQGLEKHWYPLVIQWIKDGKIKTA